MKNLIKYMLLIVSIMFFATSCKKDKVTPPSTNSSTNNNIDISSLYFKVYGKDAQGNDQVIFEADFINPNTNTPLQTGAAKEHEGMLSIKASRIAISGSAFENSYFINIVKNYTGPGTYLFNFDSNTQTGDAFFIMDRKYTNAPISYYFKSDGNTEDENGQKSTGEIIITKDENGIIEGTCEYTAYEKESLKYWISNRVEFRLAVQ